VVLDVHAMVPWGETASLETSAALTHLTSLTFGVENSKPPHTSFSGAASFRRAGSLTTISDTITHDRLMPTGPGTLARYHNMSALHHAPLLSRGICAWRTDRIRTPHDLEAEADRAGADRQDL
jgi:hypothetical protein